MSSLRHTLPRGARRVVTALWSLAALGGFALVLHLAFDVAGDHTQIFDVAQIACYLALGALCLLRAHFVAEEARTWWLFGLGMVLFGLAEVYYRVVVVNDATPPFPSPADGLWLAFTLLAIVGLVMLVRGRVPNIRGTLNWVDGVVGLLALSSLAVLLSHPVIASTGGSAAAVATNLSYTLADVVVLGVLLCAYALNDGRPGYIFGVLTMAFLVMLGADTVYLFQSSAGTYATNTPLDLTWPLGMAMMVHAAWQTPVPRSQSHKAAGRGIVVVPITLLVIAITLTVYGLFTHLSFTAATLISATLIASFARAMIAFAQISTLVGTKALLERNALILDSASEGIVGVDNSARVTFANATVLEMFGLTMRDAIGQKVSDFEIEPGMGRRADGTRFPLEYKVTPMVEGGRATGAVLVISDVTERRKIERMKDEFTSVVSHELRTPLTSIRGSLGLLAGGLLGPLSEKAQAMADIAVQNTDRLVRLINDMLDIERLENGGVTLAPERCDAAELIEQAVETMRPLAASCNIRLETDTTPVTLTADPDRVLQTLANLLSNAIKFSDPGTAVCIACARDGDAVRFEVRDQGRGIPEDMRETVFERFEQVDGSDAREKGGTGLGLAICKSIVEQHGGRIWAAPGAAGGTTFTFVLPADAEAVPFSVPATATPLDAPLVLVCDDDPSVLEMVATLVEEHGYRVARAGSGGAAIRLAREEHPDAVVLDLLMPGMDGWETAAALRREAVDVPIVILSVLAQGESPLDADLDVVAWLDKPLHEASLLDALSRAVHRGEAPSRHPDRRGRATPRAGHGGQLLPPRHRDVPGVLRR